METSDLIRLNIIREEVPKVMQQLQQLRDIASENSPNLQAHINRVIYEMFILEKELGLRRYDLEAATQVKRDIRGRVIYSEAPQVYVETSPKTKGEEDLL